jgi:hypothetical protein
MLVPLFLLGQQPLAAQDVAGEPPRVTEAENGVSEEGASETAGTKARSQSFFSLFSLSLGVSVLFFPESDGLRSDPMPVLPSAHVALDYPFAFLGSSAFSAGLSLDGYLTHYRYNHTLKKAVPAAIENRESLVIGPVVSVRLQGKTGIGPVFFARYYLGMAFDLRIVLIAEDLNEVDLASASDSTELTRNYFWGENRWIFPTAGIGFDFKTAPAFSFGIDGQVWMPLNGLQSGAGQTNFDDWRFGVGFRITFMSETPDKIINRDLNRIKEKYAITDNSYAFILYHLSKNPPLYGIEPARLADVIAKTYRHSGLYAEERAVISAGKIIDMFTDVPSLEKNYSYDPAGDVIRKK